MPAARLHPSQITGLTAAWPEDVRSLALDARALVLEIAPVLAEKVAFKALCYFKPDAPYGAIGGNVCLVTAQDDHLELAFLHGASLPDPAGLLRGDGKAKRRIVIRTREDLLQPAVSDLIRVAIAYEPTA
jgi:hypothetical protein